MSTVRSIRVGVVGSGFMAKAHANAYHTIPYIYHQAPYKVELKAICATGMEKAQAAAARYGFERAATGWQALVEDPEIDLIDICGPDALHAAIAMEAIKRGKHVLCEKPLATNARDALEMREAAAARAGLKAMTGFNYRFIGAVRLAKNLINAGVMGRVYHFNGEYAQDVGASPETPLEKLWYAYGPKSSGVALGIGCHLIDMARHLTGEITEVTGALPIYNTSRDSASGKAEVSREEDMLIVAAFEQGARGMLRASAVSAGRKNSLRFELSCSKGSLRFDLESPSFLEVFLMDSPVREVSGFTRVNVTEMDRGHPFAEYWWPRGHVLGWEHAHINEIAHLLECIALDKPVAKDGADFDDGYRACRVIDSLKEAVQTGTAQKIVYL